MATVNLPKLFSAEKAYAFAGGPNTSGRGFPHQSHGLNRQAPLPEANQYLTA